MDETDETNGHRLSATYKVLQLKVLIWYLWGTQTPAMLQQEPKAFFSVSRIRTKRTVSSSESGIDLGLYVQKNNPNGTYLHPT